MGIVPHRFGIKPSNLSKVGILLGTVATVPAHILCMARSQMACQYIDLSNVNLIHLQSPAHKHSVSSGQSIFKWIDIAGKRANKKLKDDELMLVDVHFHIVM